jgi:MerC mercury resistance protein
MNNCTTKITLLYLFLLLLGKHTSGLVIQKLARITGTLQHGRSRRSSQTAQQSESLFFRSDPNAVPPEVFGAGLIQTLDNSSTRFVTPQSHVRYRFMDQLETQYQTQSSRRGWKAVVRTISNLASLLCVIDCTLLPILTILFPLLNMALPLESVHQFGHAIAMFFVLPVGTLTTAFNFNSHGRIQLLTISMLGLIMIGLANSHAVPFHVIHHGWGHRLVNVAGCTALLTSNYRSHQLLHKNCDC